jgi:hypothetical protein
MEQTDLCDEKQKSPVFSAAPIEERPLDWRGQKNNRCSQKMRRYGACWTWCWAESPFLAE